MAHCLGMSQNDISTTRRAIASLGPTKHLRRYDATLRSRLAELVRAHPEHSVASLARELDMAPATLQRIVASAAVPIVPVRVVRAKRPRTRMLPAETAPLIVRGPFGLLVEGLDLSGVADLIRALS